MVVSDLRPEAKGSRFESGCQLCAEVSSPQQSPGQCLSAREAGGSGREESNRYPPPSPAVPWIVNAREKKTQIEKKIRVWKLSDFCEVSGKTLNKKVSCHGNWIYGIKFWNQNSYSSRIDLCKHITFLEHWCWCPWQLNLASFIMFADVSKISAQENTSQWLYWSHKLSSKDANFNFQTIIYIYIYYTYIYYTYIYYTYIFLLQIFSDTHC